VARDAPGAIEIFPTENFELVIVDQTLPGTSGLDLAKNLRQEAPEVILVLISGWGQKEILDRALASSVDLVAEKPITLEKLGDLLKKAGSLFRQRRQGS